MLFRSEELKTVHRSSVAISKMSAITGTEETFKPMPEVNIPKAPAPMEDSPYSEMTIRDYYAMRTGRPVSAKPWLNELIKSK